MDRHKPLLVEILSKQSGVRHVIERNDVPVRTTEDLPLIAGSSLEAIRAREIDVKGVRFLVDFLHGQKTGFYLDQIENYSIGELCSGAARSRLLFQSGRLCSGLRGPRCARGDRGGKHGRERRKLRENSMRNGLRVSVAEEDVFSFFKAAERRGDRYDLIILDPPSFTRPRQDQ